MDNGQVDLNRSFCLIPKSANGSDDFEFQSYGQEGVHWPDLEKEFRCVILAEAGAGKSYEMEARARYIAEDGRKAFLIRIEEILEQFNDAFEIGNAELFKNWLKSEEEAWVFLDSVDEARLKDPRQFKKAIKSFSTHITNAKQRAHIFVSSRPYAWRSCSDVKIMEKYLSFEKPRAEQTGSFDIDLEQIDSGESSQPESVVNVYFLAPLRENDIREFAKRRNASNIDQLILDLRRADILSIAERPFDLQLILDKWRDDGRLDGRLQLLRHNIALRLKEVDTSRSKSQPLKPEKAMEGARLLAAAVVLTGESGIGVPDDTHSRKGIDAETILGDWEPEHVDILLQRGLFSPALYGMVRFRHREITELLAAEWFRDHLQNGGSRRCVTRLFFRKEYDQQVIAPRLRPVLPWLLLFDHDFRQKAIKIAPEIAIEGGNPASLPCEERRVLLRHIVERIVSAEVRRSALYNSAIARLARADLADTVKCLITSHYDNDDAISFLGRLVSLAGMEECPPDLFRIASDPKRGIDARTAAIRAVMACGAEEQKTDLWRTLNSLSDKLPSQLLPSQLFAELIQGANPGISSIELLLESLAKLENCNRLQFSGLNSALHDFIDKLTPCETARLLDELSRFLLPKSGIDPLTGLFPEEFHWLIGHTIHAIEKLITSHSKHALETFVLTILRRIKVPKCMPNNNSCKLTKNVSDWTDLNDSLFWHTIEEERKWSEKKRQTSLEDVLILRSTDHFWSFGAHRFDDVLNFIDTRPLEDDKLVALSLAYQIFEQASCPSDWLDALRRSTQQYPALKERLDSFQNSSSKKQLELSKRTRELSEEQAELEQQDTDWVNSLKKNPDVLHNYEEFKSGKITHNLRYLLKECLHRGFRKYGDGAAWKTLIAKFGQEVAEAYRDAAMAFWRHFKPPLHSENHGTCCDNLTFGRVGLEIEAREGAGFPSNLSETDIRHALRYIFWELNGFPKWFDETLYRAYPELVLEAVKVECCWALDKANTEQTPQLILQTLRVHAPWLHESLAVLILDWLEQNEISNPNAFHSSILILISGKADRQRLAELAKSKIEKRASIEQLPVWYALWVDTDAATAIPALEKWLSSQCPDDASCAAQIFITKLVEEPSLEGHGTGYRTFRTADHLKSLYNLMHLHIQIKDDIKPETQGWNRNNWRDKAQDAREALLNQLFEIPGKATYLALSELAQKHPDPDYRPWIKKRAYERAETDANLEPWSAEQVREFFKQQTMKPNTHKQLFELAVSQLIDLKDFLERGNDSPFETWRRVESEAEMRNLVARELRERSKNRYNVTQENELANGQRPDIWILSDGVSPSVPIELKLLDKDWSGLKLCERLRNQLAGDYLREANNGIMLLFWCGCSSRTHWRIGDQKVALDGLENALKEYWGTISDNYPKIEAIEIIVIDLTARDMVSGKS